MDYFQQSATATLCSPVQGAKWWSTAIPFMWHCRLVVRVGSLPSTSPRNYPVTQSIKQKDKERKISQMSSWKITPFHYYYHFSTWLLIIHLSQNSHQKLRFNSALNKLWVVLKWFKIYINQTQPDFYCL